MPNKAVSTQDQIKSFINNLKRKGKSKSTLIAYQKDIEQFTQHIDKAFEDLDENDLKVILKLMQQRYLLSPKSLSRKINAIRTFYKYLFEGKVIKSNPSLKLQHPKLLLQKPRILKSEEISQIREHSLTNKRLYTMIELLLQTGIRISELSELKFADIVLRGAQPSLIIKNSKDEIERLVPLNVKIQNVLEDYIHENTNKSKYLFFTKTGRNIEIRNIRGLIDKVLSKAKIDACVNDLRNTFIVFQLQKGISVNIVAEVVGHTNLQTTIKYTEYLGKKYEDKGLKNVTEI